MNEIETLDKFEYSYPTIYSKTLILKPIDNDHIWYKALQIWKVYQPQLWAAFMSIVVVLAIIFSINRYLTDGNGNVSAIYIFINYETFVFTLYYF